MDVNAIPRWTRLYAGAVLLVVSGCQVPDRPGERIAQRPEPGPREVSGAPESAGREQLLGETAEPSLAAIQEFLERTREYADASPKGHARPDASSELRLPDRSVSVPRDGRTDARPTPRPAAGVDPAEHSSPRTGDLDAVLEHSTAIANVQMEVTNLAERDLRALPRLLSLRARSRSADGEMPPARTADSVQLNQPAMLNGPPPPVSLQACFAALEQQAEQSTEAGNEWALWLTRLANDRPLNAANAGDSFAPHKREVFRGFLSVATDLREWLRNPRASTETLLKSTEALHAYLADVASPSVEHIALCRRVVAYGVYEELPETALLEGREIQVIVYSEVANLASELQDSGEYRTRASTRIELLSEDGVSMWSHEEPAIEDLCRRKRRDFFIAQRVTFPPTLTAGRLVLKITVEDLARRQATEALHPLQILPSASIAEGRGR